MSHNAKGKLLQGLTKTEHAKVEHLKRKDKITAETPNDDVNSRLVNTHGDAYLQMF